MSMESFDQWKGVLITIGIIWMKHYELKRSKLIHSIDVWSWNNTFDLLLIFQLPLLNEHQRLTQDYLGMFFIIWKLNHAFAVIQHWI